MSRSLIVAREYHFEAAHFLPNVPDTHKCKRLHGHNYKLEVTLSGPVQQSGFIIDFWDMDKVVQPILDEVDHRCLNDIAGLENPTAENITGWFFDRIDVGLVGQFFHDVGVVAVTVWETDTCKAVLTGV